jgi:hypothetical protein
MLYQASQKKAVYMPTQHVNPAGTCYVWRMMRGASLTTHFEPLHKLRAHPGEPFWGLVFRCSMMTPSSASSYMTQAQLLISALPLLSACRARSVVQAGRRGEDILA